MIKPYKCVIMANGNFPSSPLPLKLLEQAETIIACDGAVQSLHDRGFSPAAIIGDIDSIPENLQTLYAEKIHQIIDQETNDLTKAVHFVHELGISEVLILGATGLREDHALGNISLLADYTDLFDQIEMLSDYGLFTPLTQTTTLNSMPGQQISIFSLPPDKEITTHNLRYPINNRILTSWWQGTLNEAIGTEFTISLKPNARVILFRELTPQMENSLI